MKEVKFHAIAAAMGYTPMDADSNCYEQMGFGHTHWLTFFNGLVTMRAETIEGKEVYNTGQLDIEPGQLGTFITVFMKSYPV